MISSSPEVLISNWLDLIQLGRDGTTLLRQLSKDIHFISKTNAFYSLPIHLASQILTSAGKMPFKLATKIVDGFKQKIGKDAIFLMNCLTVEFNKENNVAALLKHFVEFPMLAEISSFASYKPKEKPKEKPKLRKDDVDDDEEESIDIDYESQCHQLEIQVKELQMKLERRIKIVPKEPKVKPKNFAKSKLPKNIRLTIQECVDNNDVEALEYLLDKDINKLQESVRDRNKIEQSGFCAAVANKQTELAVAFVEHGADPYEKVKFERNPNFQRRFYRNEKVLDSMTAFEFAERHIPELALALCRTGKTKMSPIEFAIKSRKLDIVKKVIEEDGINPTDGLEFVNYSTSEITEYLLASGADPNAVGSDSIPYIFKSGDKIGIFLEHGADPNITDPDGRTPIFNYFNNPKVVEMLINAGADVNAKTKKGESLLHFQYLFSVRNEGTVTSYKKFGSFRIDEMARKGLCKENYSSIELVLKHGADPNATFNGETVLNILIRNSQKLDNDLLIIKLLIEYGAVPDQASFDLVNQNDKTSNTTKSVINDLLQYALAK